MLWNLVLAVSSIVLQSPQQAPPGNPLGSSAGAEASRARGQQMAQLCATATERYARGDFEGVVAALEAAARLDPSNPAAQQIVATYYWERASSGPDAPDIKARYVARGIAATDRALAIDSEYFEAVIFKNLLLREQANTVADPSRKQRLIAQADTLRARGAELMKARAADPSRHPLSAPPCTVIAAPSSSAPLPPPPPPPPTGVRKSGRM
jgi:hypothetical protein